MRHHLALLFLLAIAAGAAGQQLPQPDHIVVVIMENKGYSDVIGSPSASYINGTLVPMGTAMANSYGLHHPSQPNYLELFSGSEQGVCNDKCRGNLTAPNLAASILASADQQRNTFIGYAENFNPECLPTVTSGQYAQKHCPWRDFTNLPATASADFSQFPADFTKLPAVAFVIPDLYNDMHSVDPNDPATKTAKLAKHNGKLAQNDTIALEVGQGDRWLQQHIDAYAKWAVTNNSLLIITWDENSDIHYLPPAHCPGIDTDPVKKQNHIPTIIVGQHVIAGHPGTMTVTHWNVLRTILDMEGLTPIGASANPNVLPITGIWQ